MIPIMPISVRDTTNAIQLGADRAELARKNLLGGIQAVGQGFNDMGKGFENLHIMNRLKDEEDAQNAWNQYDRDLAAWNEKAGLQSNDQGIAEALAASQKAAGQGFDSDAFNEELPDLEGSSYVGSDPRDITYESADGKLFGNVEVRNPIGSLNVLPPTIGETMQQAPTPPSMPRSIFPTTVARAAETAGINTGYMRPSDLDRMRREQDYAAEIEQQKQMMSKGLMGMDIPTQNLYRSILGKSNLNDSDKAMFAQYLGHNKGLQEAMNGLEQFAETDASGNLSKRAQGAIATAATNLAAGLNAEAKRLTDAASSAKPAEAREYRSRAQQLAAQAGSIVNKTQGALRNNAQNLGKDAMLVLAAVIEDSFGTNKQAAAIETNKLIAQASRAYDPAKMRDYLSRGNPLAASQIVPEAGSQEITNEAFINWFNQLSDEQIKNFMRTGTL